LDMAGSEASNEEADNIVNGIDIKSSYVVELSCILPDYDGDDMFGYIVVHTISMGDSPTPPITNVIAATRAGLESEKPPPESPVNLCCPKCPASDLDLAAEVDAAVKMEDEAVKNQRLAESEAAKKAEEEAENKDGGLPSPTSPINHDDLKKMEEKGEEEATKQAKIDGEEKKKEMVNEKGSATPGAAKSEAAASEVAAAGKQHAINGENFEKMSQAYDKAFSFK